MKLTKGKKGVFNPVSLFFIFVIFDIVWIFAIAPIFDMGFTLGVTNGATGLEAFLMANYNLWILLFQGIALLASIYFGE